MENMKCLLSFDCLWWFAFLKLCTSWLWHCNFNFVLQGCYVYQHWALCNFFFFFNVLVISTANCCVSVCLWERERLASRFTFKEIWILLYNLYNQVVESITTVKTKFSSAVSNMDCLCQTVVTKWIITMLF